MQQGEQGDRKKRTTGSFKLKFQPEQNTIKLELTQQQVDAVQKHFGEVSNNPNLRTVDDILNEYHKNAYFRTKLDIFLSQTGSGDNSAEMGNRPKATSKEPHRTKFSTLRAQKSVQEREHQNHLHRIKEGMRGLSPQSPNCYS